MPSSQDPLTPPADQDLRGKTLRGGAITVAAQVVKFTLQMASTMILARLLTPADFGLLAMVTVMTGFLNVIRDAGLSTATVQKSEITSGQVSALFWINVALGILFTSLSVVFAPLLGWLYREPRLPPITMAVGVTFLINGLAVQHLAMLRRQMRFLALALTDIIPMLAGTGVGVAMALSGFGYWSLVGMAITSGIAALLTVWVALPWRPEWPRRGCGIRPLLRFGSFVTGSNILNYVFRMADNVLIGWYWGAASLGLYTKAYGLLLLPVNQVNTPLGNVAVPALSRTQAEPERFRRYFLAAYSLIASAIMPILVALMVYAEEAVMLLLGPAWSEAVPLFRLLAPAALIGALLNPFGWLFVATGRPDRQFKLGIVWSSLIVGSFAAGLPFGPKGVAIGYSVMSALLAIPLCRYSIEGTRVQVSDLWQAVQAPLLAALVAGALGLLVKLALPETLPMAARALLGGTVLIAAYGLFLGVVLRKWPFYRGLLRELFPTRFAGKPV